MLKIDRLKDNIEILKNKNDILIKIQINNQQFHIRPKNLEIIYDKIVSSYCDFVDKEYKDKIKPPFVDCIPFNEKECKGCDNEYECEFQLQERACPFCKKKDTLFRDVSSSNENYLECESCGKRIKDEI